MNGRPEHPWAKHYQHAWAERSGDPNLPDWLRVAALAYGKHSANGHASFAPGDLALVLGTIDRETGELRPSRNVSRAIQTAVRYGWLATGSRTRCLVVPAFAVSGGLGSEYAKCQVHGVTQ